MSEDRPYATVSTPDLLLLHMALAENEDLVIGACGILKRIMREISLRRFLRAFSR